MTAVATSSGAAGRRSQQTEAPARLADRPLLTTPTDLHRPEFLDTQRERLSRQPLLGLEGLALVAPVAALIAFGAGGAQRSVLVLAPLVTFALAPIVMIAFWWEDWPGTRLRASWSGWFDTLLIAAVAVLLTGLAQIVVGRLDVGGIFNPTPGQGRVPTFPATMPLGGAAFVAMIELTLVTEGWPLRRLGRVVGGLLALAFSCASALAVYFALVDFTPPPGSGLTRRHGWLSNGQLGAALVIRVQHMVGAFAPGRVLNPRTARSQLMGGMLWGMSQALLEGTRMDTRHGRWANASLGDYLVPVNADAPDVDVELIEVEDHVAGPLGVKGVGEIGQVGSAAAIANAVYHATGYRARELPIAVEHLLAHLPSGPASAAAGAQLDLT